MAMNTKEVNHVLECQKIASRFVDLKHSMEILANQQADGILTGIADGDLTTYGITKSNLEKVQTSHTELEKWWNNQTVTNKQNGQWMRALMNTYEIKVTT